MFATVAFFFSLPAAFSCGFCVTRLQYPLLLKPAVLMQTKRAQFSFEATHPDVGILQETPNSIEV